jgi:hypothetical protein
VKVLISNIPVLMTNSLGNGTGNQS